ncbi:PD-(D/E)XK nuclease family protein [Paenibacillus sp. D2_2]|uniref:PD-(D/E)XK nuclease family protein n=1 Tax=Paenibacillus sp. D2_2 TaxID=3073092 RepID=UPI002814C28D|nr:PD-(D/E)XK nuclease family protein [Paenibacillus sp. D2_2]WMT42263.1 PD-(D/E)XK nuclease family protein [Paenibacillus sp. D2_2]
MDLIDRLYQKINEDRWSQVVLLVSSYAQGHQLLERVCERHGAIFNVNVQTLQGIVADKIKLELFRKKISLLEEGEKFWVIRWLMKQLTVEEPAGYITESMLKPGIVNHVYRVISELRMAGIRSEDMTKESFMNSDKGEYLKQLLARYEAYLLEHHRTDFAGVIEYLNPGVGDIVYLASNPTGWTYIESQMVQKLSGGRVVLLDLDSPFNLSEHFRDNQFNMFRATGSFAEVREGFRRILSEPESLDRTEIILSDYERYAPVVFSLTETLGIDCTLSNGLPLTFSVAGKVVMGMLDWLAEDFPVSRLSEMYRHGYLEFPVDRWSRTEWVQILDKSGIGWGKERYYAALSPERLSEEMREQGAILFTYINEWFKELPDSNEWNPLFLLGWLSDFLQKYVPIRSLDDANVKTTLQEMANRYETSLSEPMSLELAIRYVQEMINEVRIGVSATPRPGAVHISSMQNGGWSGRNRTWIAGVDERAWSIPVVQDPLLLDTERYALSEHLEPAFERAKRVRSERESRLSQMKGELWLSYSSYDIGEQKNQSPAYEMLQVLWLQTEDLGLDFGDLEHSLGEPFSVMDVMHKVKQPVPLDGVDTWSRLLQDTNGKRRDGWRAMLQTYPTLAQGYQAQKLRLEDWLSAYDGWLDVDISLHSNDSSVDMNKHFISASQLEKYASCGMHYYFYYVLKLQQKDIVRFDPTRWLQASERGSLLHDIFKRYLEEVTNQGKKLAEHNRERLLEITETVIKENATFIPAPNVHVFEKECEEIRRDVEIFYHNESLNMDQPCYFELELTLANGEPMDVDLPGGMRIRLKGFVDRVDRIGPHEYRIIDYKTGSTRKYKALEYFSGGTQLQHALYSVAVEQWLRETGIDSEARVVEAVYYFPTERGRGESVKRVQDRRGELAGIVVQLLESRDRGIYIPTKDSKLCQWCDYQAVCGSHPESMTGKRKLPDNAPILSKLLEVEGIE